MPRQLIITADDYGFTPAINRGIEACVQAGTVKSICVMTNMPHWRSIKQIKKSHPDVSIGIHWTVSQGKPVLSRNNVSTLITSDGYFLPPTQFRNRYRQGEIDLSELESELGAQLAMLREEVQDIAYWNTHQNIHVSFGCFHDFVRIASKLGIQVMRNHFRFVAHTQKANWKVLLRNPLFGLKGVILYRWAKWARSNGMFMPAGIIANIGFGPGHTRLLDTLSVTTWQGIAEVAVHPADSIDGLEGATTLVTSRIKEYQLLSSESFVEQLLQQEIELVNFSAVCQQ